MIGNRIALSEQWERLFAALLFCALESSEALFYVGFRGPHETVFPLASPYIRMQCSSCF
jgi:hypothetical protein